jgi:hypothetical protein
MKTRIMALVGIMALGGALLLSGTALAAGADPGPSGKGICAASATAARAAKTVAAWRAFGDCEIDRRFATLDDLDARIAASKALTVSEAAALKSEIANTRAGLRGLRSAIDTQTAPLAIRADVVKIATDWRVYLLVVPQVRLVNASDAVLAAGAGFATVNDTLSARITKETAVGKDVSAAKADLAAMNTSVADAIALAKPLPAQLLALTPASYDAGPGKTALDQARADLVKARDDLASALSSAKAARDALK